MSQPRSICTHAQTRTTSSLARPVFPCVLLGPGNGVLLFVPLGPVIMSSQSPHHFDMPNCQCHSISVMLCPMTMSLFKRKAVAFCVFPLGAHLACCFKGTTVSGHFVFRVSLQPVTPEALEVRSLEHMVPPSQCLGTTTQDVLLLVSWIWLDMPLVRSLLASLAHRVGNPTPLPTLLVALITMHPTTSIDQWTCWTDIPLNATKLGSGPSPWGWGEVRIRHHHASSGKGIVCPGARVHDALSQRPKECS